MTFIGAFDNLNYMCVCICIYVYVFVYLMYVHVYNGFTQGAPMSG